MLGGNSGLQGFGVLVGSGTSVGTGGGTVGGGGSVGGGSVGGGWVGGGCVGGGCVGAPGCVAVGATTVDETVGVMLAEPPDPTGVLEGVETGEPFWYATCEVGVGVSPPKSTGSTPGNSPTG